MIIRNCQKLLRKAASFKSTDPELRDLIYKAERNVGKQYYDKAGILGLLLTQGPGAILGGWGVAGLTPTWDKEDLKDFIKRSKNRGRFFIPGKPFYDDMKVLGAVLQARRDGVLPSKDKAKKDS